MKSRITIEVDFDNGNMPVIQILSRNSDDVRDNLLKSFLQSLQHTSRWGVIHYAGSYGELSGVTDGVPTVAGEVHRWVIKPITPQQIPEEIKLMQATYRDFYPTKNATK